LGAARLGALAAGHFVLGLVKGAACGREVTATGRQSTATARTQFECNLRPISSFRLVRGAAV
jgi:hypothetical protein